MASDSVKSRIKGTGSALPHKIITNHDLEKMVDTSDEWISTRTGIRERHIAENDEFLSQFVIKASIEALHNANLKGEDVELIIIATVTPDQPIPSTACFVQHALGNKKAACFDMQAGCTGFIYAISVADQFLRAGTYKNALVIGAETLSKYLDWQDRATCVIFADGAGAVVLSAEEGENGIIASALYSDGSMADLICMPGGGSRYPQSETVIAQNLHRIKMKGSETFKIAIRSLESVCIHVLEKAGVNLSEVKWFIPHQANERIIKAVAERLKFPEERVYINIDRIGNTSSASIPIALNELTSDNKIKDGDYVLFCAFGAGLTWGAALLKW